MTDVLPESDVVDDDDAHGGDEPAFGNPAAVAIQFNVPSELDGCRADAILVWKVRRLSRTRAQTIMKRGDFRLENGASLKPSARLASGTTVALWRIPPDAKSDVGPTPAVIFEDDDLLVVDKPADLAVHPSARYLHRTLTAWLRARTPDGERVAHPCHRLDRETSGVLICAKNSAADRTMKMAFQESQMQKVYAAIVRGRVTTSFTIDRPLALQGDRGVVRIRMIDDDDGLPSRTDFEPVCVDEKRARTLVRCFPKTGRQHQIRAHLAINGTPIVGDKLYAMGDAFFDAWTKRDADHDESLLEHHRHALHAASLTIPDGRVFEAAMPTDMRALIDGLDVTSSR